MSDATGPSRGGHQVVFEIELEAATEPIRGVINPRPGGDQVRFAGWVGLASAIERVLQREHPQGGRPQSQGSTLP